VDIEDAARRFRRALGQAAPAPRKFAKYPLENKLYHLAILCAGLAVIGTGILMMSRVRTPFFTRDPYLFGFSDMTWGWMYVLHGLSGIALVALIIAHVYFALRPEKLFITKSMIFGWMSREQYLEHHDPRRWPVGEEAPEAGAPGGSKSRVPA
jgi:thiosulfate reductase cytochrome b subunit